VLLGPRQIGKTTLALEVAEARGGVYRDLENPRDLDQVRDVVLFNDQFPDRLIILDEVNAYPRSSLPCAGSSTPGGGRVNGQASSCSLVLHRSHCWDRQAKVWLEGSPMPNCQASMFANSRKIDSPELTPILSGFAEDIPTA